MYVLFGTKWSKLFCGPLRNVESTEQGSSAAQKTLDPLTVRTFFWYYIHAMHVCISAIGGAYNKVSLLSLARDSVADVHVSVSSIVCT